MNQSTAFTSFVFILISFFMFSGCNLFESTTVSSQEIAKASSWTSTDIGPSFEVCEGKEADEMNTCFKEIVTSTIKEFLLKTTPVASQRIEEEVLATLRVDEKGYFSLMTVDISNALRDALPDFEKILKDAVNQLPQAKPAIKSNVGIFVVSEFQLPIRILAQESN